MLQAIRYNSKRALLGLSAVIVVYAALAYVLLPFMWRHFEHQKDLAGFSMLTRTGDKIPGDPINVGLIGAKDDVLCAMHAAMWYPADPITLRSSIEIVGSVLLDRPYRDAPMSHLYFDGRRQDFSFEKPVGSSADRRHHVRFWKALDRGQEGRAVWLGAVTFDRGVGFSHDDARITHHIGPDIDAERDLMTANLAAAKVVTVIYEVTGIGPTLAGRNGEGDTYYTDGEVKISVLVQGCAQSATTVTTIDNPPIVELKNLAWSAITKVLLPNPPGSDR